MNGGLSWQSQTTPAAGLTGLSFPDASHGWAAGGDKLVTSNGGANWGFSGLLPSAPTSLSSVCFVDDQDGWVGGLHQPDGQYYPTGCVYRTSDGGQTWELVYDGSEVYDVCFVDARHGWLCQNSSQDTIKRTTDGGQTWTVCETQNGSEAVRDLDLCDQTHGVAAGAYGVVLTTTDGQLWLAENSGHALESIPFFAASIAGPGSAWVGGSKGTILSHPDPYLLAPVLFKARHGHKCTLTCSGSDAAAVHVTVTIKVRNRRNKVVKTLVLRGKPTNVTLKAAFQTTLPEGGYHVTFSAQDDVGKRARPIVSNLRVN